jgi:hypothetical protein
LQFNSLFEDTRPTKHIVSTWPWNGEILYNFCAYNALLFHFLFCFNHIMIIN